MGEDAAQAVLVTGGSRGIGAATARLAAARGWSVGVNYRSNAAAAEAVVSEATAQGVSAAALPADIADAAAIPPLFDAAEAALGPLRGVVVNAGVLETQSTLAEMASDRIARIVAVNLTGALITAREAARRLGPGGSIVIVSSAAARIGSANEFIDYAATKGGMDTLTIGLAREIGGKGIRVNAVRPGLIETDIHADAGRPDRAKEMSTGVPLGRPGAPEEVAEAIVWLLSDQASYVSGAIVDVTGGR